MRGGGKNKEMNCYLQPKLQHSDLQSSSELDIEILYKMSGNILELCKRLAKAIWSHCTQIRSEWACSVLIQLALGSPGRAAMCDPAGTSRNLLFDVHTALRNFNGYTD